ncbi:hypothetical protein RND71_041339 [Anisodus tanguticus]|uniref:Uncharacterized protein n=1 Tax=Anisodus tanguticus TaxID=243964 RepID=A0AAE1UR25_9SOLA|nr:hypothetical protein RND71_041339 [Anisodus tanguticus]
MDSYTKINGTNTSNKSRSKDFLDLQSFSPPHKTNENLSPNHTIFHDNIDLDSITKKQQSKNQETHDEKEKENENEEKMKGNDNSIPSGVKLSRACSVSANRFRLERQGSKKTTATTSTSFQSVKRVFSMRRTSSVSEKYCRIHDQGFTILSPILDDVAEAHEGSMEKKKKKSGRILKACKHLFGI